MNSKKLFLSALALVPVTALAQEQQKPSPFEFHGYARLGVIGDINPFKPAQDGQGAGLPSSRHVRDLNYVRVQTLANLNDGMKFNLELQIDGDYPHQKHNPDWSEWSGAKINVRNAFLEMPIAETNSKIWFGSRRMEFEDIRLFDQHPLSETTLFGAGFDTSFAGLGSNTALGIKEVDVKNPAGNDTAKAKDITLFQRFDLKLSENMAIRPTFIYNRHGGSKKDGGGTTYSKPSDNFKVGAVLSTWGDSGWMNDFVYLKTDNAAGSSKTSDKDYTFGLAASGDFEGLKDVNLGIMYGAILEAKSFKNKQIQHKIDNDAIVQDGDKTSKTAYVLAIDVQPVYYVTDRVHGALDLNYSMSNKVGAEAHPNAMLVTPILRYAASKNAMGTPQIFASFTYGKYEAKVKKDAKGKATDSLLTTQAGMEVWF